MTPITTHFRWSLAVRGIAAILFGVLAWGWPGITLLALLILFGAYALVDGVFALIGSLVHRKVVKDWWLIMLVGLASALIGMMTFARPGVTALMLMFLIAARAMIVGVLEIVAAIEYRHEIRHEWLLVLGGIISVIFGIAVLSFPFQGALAVVWVIGVYSIVLGILHLLFAISARTGENVLPTPEHPTMA